MSDTSKFADLKTRFLSAIVMVAVGATALWFGGWIFTLLIVAAVFAMHWEMGRMLTPCPCRRIGFLRNICDCVDLGPDHRQRDRTDRGDHHSNSAAAGLFSYGGYIGNAGILGHNDRRASFDPCAHGNRHDRNTMDHRAGRDHGYCRIFCWAYRGWSQVLACV